MSRRREAAERCRSRLLIVDELGYLPLEPDAALGVPTELRSRTLHHTGDLPQLANKVYSAYDFLPERLRAP